MLDEIIFTDKRFDKSDDNNVLEFTDNTIILCNNLKLMDSLAEEIFNTVNGNAEHNDYWCDDYDVGKAKYVLNFGLQKVIDINGQRITLCLEPAMIYKAKNIQDIWFFDCIEDEEKEFIYPMFAFKRSQDIWNRGHDEVYKAICKGWYGCYDGKWINLEMSDNDVRIL